MSVDIIDEDRDSASVLVVVALRRCVELSLIFLTVVGGSHHDESVGTKRELGVLDDFAFTFDLEAHLEAERL